MNNMKEIVLKIEFWKCHNTTKEEMINWIEELMELHKDHLQWSWYNFLTNTRDLHYKIDFKDI